MFEFGSHSLIKKLWFKKVLLVIEIIIGVKFLLSDSIKQIKLEFKTNFLNNNFLENC